MKKAIPTLIISSLLILTSQLALAGSATWVLNPTGQNWNTPRNWMPNTIPNGPTDVATFDVSNSTNVNVSVDTEVDSIVFPSGAGQFDIHIMGQGASPSTLTISGAGVVNNSGTTQQIDASPDQTGGGVGNLTLTGNAVMGSLMMITNAGGSSIKTAICITTFADNSSAGDATVLNLGGTGSTHPQAGSTRFVGNATAANGTFICLSGAEESFGAGGNVRFSDNSTAADGTFLLTAGFVGEPDGGYASFYNTASAGNGVFTLDGSVTADGGGFVQFYDTSTAGNATLIANGGTVDGGHIDFFGESTGGTARVELFGNGTLNLDDFQVGRRTIGSLEGDGIVLLGARTLSIGSNSLSTTFSGTIEGTGAITKIGSGALTLSGASTYSGGTTITAGSLIVANTTGSATGTGGIAVNRGRLGGSGIVSGPVTVGTGSGSGAFLAPAGGGKIPSTFTTASTLTFQAGATYTCTARARSTQVQADKVVANEVTISGATFTFLPKISGTLPAGTVFTVISNTGADPINGTFSNLADGATITAGGTNFQADYEGGDGNDLTLTVVP